MRRLQCDGAGASRLTHSLQADLEDADGAVLQPDAALSLERVSGYTGEFTRTLLWAPGGDELVFTSASVIVIMSCAHRHWAHRL